MPKNINCTTIITTSGGIEKLWTGKKIQSEIFILYTVKCATLRDRLMITCSFQFLVYIFSFPVKGFKSAYRRTSTDKQLSTATVCHTDGKDFYIVININIMRLPRKFKTYLPA